MLNDYQAALEAVAVFDLSARAKIELTGRDAREFLTNLCTQDVKNLPVGAVGEAFLTTNKARVIAQVWIWHRKPDVLLLDCDPLRAKTGLDHLNHYLISERVEVRDCTSEFTFLRVVGPNAATLLTCLGLPTARSHRLLALDGVDLLCPDGDGDAALMHDRIIEAGAIPGTAETYQTLRIEAGLPEYGIDIDENRLAMEVNRNAQAICYTKGCFLGQETIVMARDRGQVNRLLMGIKVAGDAVLAPGTKLFRAGEEVGQVTSSTLSPRFGQVVALAYLRRGSWDAGTEVVIDSATSERTAFVSALPFLGGAVSVLP